MLTCVGVRNWRSNFTSLRRRQNIGSCRVDESPVASDVSYGGKEVVQVTDALYNYILDHTREPDILRRLREETSTIHGSSMQVSPEQAQLLAMLVQIMGAQRCIEVGVFTGYSSLAVALALPDSGRLVACERCELHLGTALKYYHLAGVSHKVTARCGLALDSLQQLLDNGEAESYDFSFVDADKRNNPQYYELLLRLVRPGGLIVIDNVLWHGKVADPQVTDFKTHCIRKFNRHLLFDKRVSISMVPIGDGMTICRKL